MWQTNIKYDQSTKNIFHISCSLITISNLSTKPLFQNLQFLEYALESSAATGIAQLFSTLSLDQLFQKF